jgi:hypothetical protein
MFNPDTSPHYYVYLRSFEAVARSIAVRKLCAGTQRVSHPRLQAICCISEAIP